jgi:hypothetical protein
VYRERKGRASVSEQLKGEIEKRTNGNEALGVRVEAHALVVERGSGLGLGVR